MRYIPAGSFAMGSPADEKQRISHEGPQTQVRLTQGFWMLETEVTQGQYKALIGSNPSYFFSCGDSCPVEQVSWDQARVFADKLSAAQDLTACTASDRWIFKCGGWRLPTEAEWEYAARAETTTRFHTGDCLTTDQANFHGHHPPEGCPKGEYRGKTLPVGTFASNAWGCWICTEMSGSGPWAVSPTPEVIKQTLLYLDLPAEGLA